jgi:NAD(P)-dependent dehydrogenase (short-subunit alcohol dehydrogenase family)
MLRQQRGTITFTGATTSVRGGARFGAFAASKFALRGLAQSLAREYGPKGIHVTHVIIDGIIDTARIQVMMGTDPGRRLRADAIAETYIQLVAQERSAWTQELDLRPHVEPF